MKWLLLLVGFLLTQTLGASTVTPGLTPEREARYKALIAELRCLVCQNQSLLDSDASLAVDLRREVLKHIEAGETDTQIIEFLVARYGDFVRYRPPFKATTALLWAGPLLLLLLGLALLLRRRTRQGEPVPPPSAAQLAKLRAMRGPIP